MNEMLGNEIESKRRENGPFENGPFENGPWKMGLWKWAFWKWAFENGPFENGAFENGPLEMGLWKWAFWKWAFWKWAFENGPFENGPLKMGLLKNGPFENGPLEMGLLKMGLLKMGLWKLIRSNRVGGPGFSTGRNVIDMRRERLLIERFRCSLVGFRSLSLAVLIILDMPVVLHGGDTAKGYFGRDLFEWLYMSLSTCPQWLEQDQKGLRGKGWREDRGNLTTLRAYSRGRRKHPHIHVCSWKNGSVLVSLLSGELA